MFNKEGPSLVPLERVAMPTVENTDKATRKMITQFNTTLIPRFPLEITGEALDYRTQRFITLTNLINNRSLKASLRVSQKDYSFFPDQPVKTISGMCLFGASGLTGETASGQRISFTDPYELKQGLSEPIVKIQEITQLHPSELETILQTTNALAALDDGGIECFFHLPTPEYKLYLIEAFRKKVLTANQLETLFGKIDRRSADLSRIVRKRLPSKAFIGSPLNCLDNLLFSERQTLTLSSALKAARQQPVLADLITVNPPAGFVDLCELSYVSGYLLAALQAEATNQGCLAVDMAYEAPIFENTKRLAEKLGINLKMAVMLLPPITITLTGRYKKQDLFMHQPNGASPLTELKTVMRHNQGGSI